MANIVKVKGRPVGIFGLELAVSKVKEIIDKEGLDRHQAAAELLKLVEKKNYVPASSRRDYLAAFEKLLAPREEDEKDAATTVRILGPGCVGCNRIEELVLEIMSERGIAADIYHVTDKDEILRYGVEKTPALVIGNKVVSAGKIPSKAQIEQWLLKK